MVFPTIVHYWGGGGAEKSARDRVWSVSPLAWAEDCAGVAVPLPLPLAVGREGFLGHSSRPGLVALEEVASAPQELLVDPAVAFDVREDLIHSRLTAYRRTR